MGVGDGVNLDEQASHQGYVFFSYNKQCFTEFMQQTLKELRCCTL